jgi:hypothetical protein
MFSLDRIFFEKQGMRISYNYTCSGNEAIFFKGRPAFFSQYEYDVSHLDPSITAIPLLANIAPIAWFAGFDISVKTLDRGFFDALLVIRAEWERHYPKIKRQKSTLFVEELVDNQIGRGGSCMLFSGGVDAFATFFRHYHENPALVTIQGADIALSDEKQWSEVVRFNESESMLAPNRKHYIKSNLRDFYNYKVDHLTDSLAWWGNIQHGLSLIGSTAPLTALFGYDKIYIASTRSTHMKFSAWGSMPEIDNLISWAGLTVIHDGFELKRQEKVEQIVRAVTEIGKDTTIRVCYSDLKKNLNCSVCEKCIRTIFGIVLAGEDPGRFGFTTSAAVYSRILEVISRGFSSKGTQFFWYELYEKGITSDNFFVFRDQEAERLQIDAILKKIKAQANDPLVVPSKLGKLKNTIFKRYPKLFKAYLKLRRIFKI